MTTLQVADLVRNILLICSVEQRKTIIQRRQINLHHPVTESSRAFAGPELEYLPEYLSDGGKDRGGGGGRSRTLLTQRFQ